MGEVLEVHHRRARLPATAWVEGAHLNGRPFSLELLLHYIDVLAACHEVMQAIRGIKDEPPAAQTDEVLVWLAFLAIEHDSPGLVRACAIGQPPTVRTEGQHTGFDI